MEVVEPEGFRGRALRVNADGGLTSRALKAMPLGALERAARQAVADQIKADEIPAADRRRLRRVAEAFSRDPNPGRRGRDPRAYAVLAEDYVRWAAGDKPFRVFAERHHLSESHARNLLTKCRSESLGPLLTAAPAGRRGGQLTEKAIELLKGRSDGEHR